MERWKAHGWPCELWPCCGTSIPMGLGYAVFSLPGDPRSMTSTASNITTIGFTTCSSLPPWEGENYEPRNPVESEKFAPVDIRSRGFVYTSISSRLGRLHRLP